MFSDKRRLQGMWVSSKKLNGLPCFVLSLIGIFALLDLTELDTFLGLSFVMLSLSCVEYMFKEPYM